MPTIREDIDYDLVRSAFNGMQLTETTQRLMVRYAEVQLKWSHEKAVKCARYIINESRATLTQPKPNTFTEVMRTLENAPTQKRAK